MNQENYQAVIRELMNQDQLLMEQLEPVLEGLNGLKEYRDDGAGVLDMDYESDYI